MSKATYFQRGESLDYPNTTTEAIEAGTVIPLISRIGIAGTTIQPGQIGSVHVIGVFEIEKMDATEIPAGTLVHFDGDGITAVSGTGTIPAGYAAALAEAGDETVLVKLMG